MFGRRKRGKKELEEVGKIMMNWKKETINFPRQGFNP
jgi:hypothetical protein